MSELPFPTPNHPALSSAPATPMVAWVAVSFCNLEKKIMISRRIGFAPGENLERVGTTNIRCCTSSDESFWYFPLGLSGERRVHIPLGPKLSQRVAAQRQHALGEVAVCQAPGGMLMLVTPVEAKVKLPDKRLLLLLDITGGENSGPLDGGATVFTANTFTIGPCPNQDEKPVSKKVAGHHCCGLCGVLREQSQTEPEAMIHPAEGYRRYFDPLNSSGVQLIAEGWNACGKNEGASHKVILAIMPEGSTLRFHRLGHVPEGQQRRGIIHWNGEQILYPKDPFDALAPLAAVDLSLTGTIVL